MTVLFAGQQIPKSPFEVGVEKALGDATKVTTKGVGSRPTGNIANRPTYFDIYTAGSIPSPPHQRPVPTGSCETLSRFSQP